MQQATEICTLTLQNHTLTLSLLLQWTRFTWLLSVHEGSKVLFIISKTTFLFALHFGQFLIREREGPKDSSVPPVSRSSEWFVSDPRLRPRFGRPVGIAPKQFQRPTTADGSYPVQRPPSRGMKWKCDDSNMMNSLNFYCPLLITHSW